MIITQIENAAIARMKAVNTVGNFGALLKTVDRYSGEFMDENMDLLVTMAPFALISHTSSQVVTNALTGARWRGEFTVICGSTSRRTQAQAMASRVGGPSAIELGSRQIAELMRDILSGQNLGLPISVFEPAAIDEVYSGPAGATPGGHFLSVTGLRLTCLYSTQRSTVADNPSVGLEEIVGVFAAQAGTISIDDPANNTVTVNLTDAGANP